MSREPLYRFHSIRVNPFCLGFMGELSPVLQENSSGGDDIHAGKATFAGNLRDAFTFENNIQHFSRRNDEIFCREVPDIPSNQIGIFTFAFFHYDLIEYASF